MVIDSLLVFCLRCEDVILETTTCEQRREAIATGFEALALSMNSIMA